MSFHRVSACVFAVATSLAGCMATNDVEYAGEVHVSSTELVELPSGVQVIADADEPLFYSDGFYWVYRDNGWMRSNTYRGGFVRVDLAYVPERVRMIQRPQTYAQYRRHHGRTMEARATPQPQRTPAHPGLGPTAPPPFTTYVPERGLPPEPSSPRDRLAPEVPRATVPPVDARDHIPPQSPQQTGPKARPEDRGNRSPIRADEEDNGRSPQAEKRDRKTDEKLDKNNQDE